LKSYALWVYFQMYSPEKTRYFPKACCKPAWNSLRQPGDSGVEFAAAQPRSGFSTTLSQPTLERTRFSLNGVSSNRASEIRKSVFTSAPTKKPDLLPGHPRTDVVYPPLEHTTLVAFCSSLAVVNPVTNKAQPVSLW